RITNNNQLNNNCILLEKNPFEHFKMDSFYLRKYGGSGGSFNQPLQLIFHKKCKLTPKVTGF
ncbi:MAG: hypothetical protein ACQEW5_28710, partial [Bacillota bacterium]